MTVSHARGFTCFKTQVFVVVTMMLLVLLWFGNGGRLCPMGGWALVAVKGFQGYHQGESELPNLLL